ncbi:hypothetical protein CFP56_022948 [Quercus suber]|uniref:Secreted protein n=1 Tax=Quercus suber TaxID=58331 RepID=A0AAW0KAI7_QUESU
MACRTALRFVFLAEPWRPVYLNRSTACASLRTRGSSPIFFFFFFCWDYVMVVIFCPNRNNLVYFI